MPRGRGHHGPGLYGRYPKSIELFEMFEEAKENPELIEQLADLNGSFTLQEAYGSPEGRIDFPYFLQQFIHHKMRERFAAVASRWEEFFGIENAQDFREHTVSSLGSIRGIEPVGEGQDYPRLRSGELPGPSYAVGKHGGIYAVTYELIVNDQVDLILDRIPAELGRSSGEYVAQTAIALIESNPTYPVDGQPFFSAAAHDNNVTGSAADLNEDNVLAILDKLSNRRDAEGIPISVKLGAIVVKNPSQKARVDQMVRSQETGVTSEVTAVGAPGFAPGRYNPLANMLPANVAKVEPWLNDPNDWYAFNEVMDRPAFVMAYLRDQREPQIFLADPGLRGVGGGAQDMYTLDCDEIPHKLRTVFGGATSEPLAAIRAQP